MAKREDPPFVHPAIATKITDPAAAAYQAGIAARRAGNAPPKDNTPVAGGPSPSIPRLDVKEPQVQNRTLSQHAQMERGLAPTPILLAADLLPEAATKDPGYRSGHGSMLAVNQPELAKKYGIVRQGRMIPPQELVPRNPSGLQLSKDTLAGLHKLQELQTNAATSTPNLFATAEEAAAAPPSDRPSMAGIGSTFNKAVTPELDEKEVTEAISKMDEFQFNQFRESIRKDPLNNEDQRKTIETRLKPLSIEDMIRNLTVTQVVPVVPGKFEATFRHISADVDLAIKRLIMEESKSIEISEQYFLDKFSLMALCATLDAINGKPLPLFRDSDGSFNDELFKHKLNSMFRYPMMMLTSLGIHAFWFERRVQQLFVVEQIKNG